MRALNARQQDVLHAIVESGQGLPVTELDGRNLRPLRSRGLVIQVDDLIRATPEGIQLVQSGEEEQELAEESLSEPSPAPTQVADPVQSAKVEEPEDAAEEDTTFRIRRLKAIYQLMGGTEAAGPESKEYALNVAFLVADVLQSKGLGARYCGKELWMEFLRVTSYWEQKEAQQIARQSLRREDSSNRRVRTEAKPPTQSRSAPPKRMRHPRRRAQG